MKCIVALLITSFCVTAAAQSGSVLENSNMLFTLRSDSFHDQGLLSPHYTCDGKDVSPQLAWQGVPPKTKSLAIVFADLDAPNGTFYHWIVYNIPPTVTSLAEDSTSLPPGAIIGKNDWKKASYNGPCPPLGSTHYYVITLYALDKVLKVDSAIAGAQLIELIQKSQIDKSDLELTYGR